MFIRHLFILSKYAARIKIYLFLNEVSREDFFLRNNRLLIKLLLFHVFSLCAWLSSYGFHLYSKKNQFNFRRRFKSCIVLVWVIRMFLVFCEMPTARGFARWWAKLLIRTERGIFPKGGENPKSSRRLEEPFRVTKLPRRVMKLLRCWGVRPRDLPPTWGICPLHPAVPLVINWWLGPLPPSSPLLRRPWRINACQVLGISTRGRPGDVEVSPFPSLVHPRTLKHGHARHTYRLRLASGENH